MSDVQRPRYNVVVPTRYGMMIVNRNDWFEADGNRYGVGHDLLASGEYVQAELDVLAALIAQCPPHPVLIDVGANIGVHTLFFASLAGPRGTVHSFEAQRVVFQMLMGNLALNSIENVHGHGMALGAEPGTLALPPMDYNKPRNFGGVALGGEAAPAGTAVETVAIMTLDSLELARVDFIKLDVEGMEEDVLRGARGTLDRCRPMMQVEWMMRDQGRLPLYLLEHLDYRVFQAGMNLLCVPVELAVRPPLQGLPEMTAEAVRQAYKL